MILKMLADEKKTTISALEKKIGVSNGTLDKIIKRNSKISSDILARILIQYPDINAKWLITGKGEMIDYNYSQAKSYNIDSVNTNVVNEPIVGYGSKSLPLIPIDAMAGFGNGEKQIMDYESETYIIPNFRGAEFLISVKGDSMYPRYNSGDIVACKKLQLNDVFFQWNKVYVLDTDQGALIKRVRKGTFDNQITLVSENDSYENFELKMNQINSIALVVGVIRLE